MTFVINTRGIHELECFADASADELRVLLTLVALGGRVSGVDELAVKAGVSRTRCAAALALWQESGAITGGGEDNVVDEFCESVTDEEAISDSSERVSREIRDLGLKELIEECAAIMERPALSSTEIKQIASLVTKYALSTEYIITLAAHLASKRRLDVTRLVNKAVKLVEKNGIDTVEELERYIKNEEERCDAEWEYCSVLGIHRALSKDEKKCFRIWCDTYGYSAVIVEEAYNVCVRCTGKYSVSYIHKVLTAWHEAGCKTLEECIANSEIGRAAAQKKTKGGKNAARGSTDGDNTPKYSGFNADDALMKALERSYGITDDKAE